jgi:hypothetical protein
MTDGFSGGLPLQLDLGWRFNPYIYVGGFFQYSFLFLASGFKDSCSQAGLSCSAGDIQFGLDFVYTILPYGGAIPYVGLGAGWEIATITGSAAGSGSVTYSGFQFLRILAGVDFRVASAFRVGPFANFSLGQYSSFSSPNFNGSIDNKALHMWLQFGLKGTVDL